MTAVGKVGIGQLGQPRQRQIGKRKCESYRATSVRCHSRIWQTIRQDLCKASEQRLRLLQIARLEPLRKPPVNRSEQFARLLHLALVAPETREAHGGAEFLGLGLLLTGDRERTLEVSFCFCCMWRG